MFADSPLPRTDRRAQERTSSTPSLSRRQFLARSSLGCAAAVLAGRLPAAVPTPVKLFPVMGAAAGLARAAEVKAAGGDFIVASVQDLLQPNQPDDVFAANLEKLAASPLPVRACNSFLRDRALRCVGPDANHPLVLDFAGRAFQRARRAGVEFIVFGSGGARQVPDGWPRERADEQFISLLQAMGPLAANEGVIVAVESLQQRECNYLTRLNEVVHVVRAAGHPAIRGLADFYHMSNMNDTPADLAAALPFLHWVEVAEKEKRTAPGVTGEDFRPFLAELVRGGYRGGITIEGTWDAAQLATGFATLRAQADAVS